MSPADLAQALLGGAGRPEETAFYLRLFRSQPGGRFAAIHLSPASFQMGRGAVLTSLRALSALELYPVILAQDAHAAHASPPHRLLAQDLQREGVEVQLVDDVQKLSRLSLHLNVPILVRLSGTPNDAPNFEEIRQLLMLLDTKRLVICRPEGALAPAGHRLDVTTPSDLQRYSSASSQSSADYQLLCQVAELLGAVLPLQVTVSVTSPLAILKELFTTRGAGTLVRAGSDILHFASWEPLDQQKVAKLLEASFQKRVKPHFFQQPVHHIFIEAGYRGAAVVQQGPKKIAYLSKWAVEPEAKGEGIGRDLWNSVTALCPQLLWRSRASNATNGWYGRVSSGTYRNDQWHIFWKNLPPSELEEAVTFALTRAEDFSLPHP